MSQINISDSVGHLYLQYVNKYNLWPTDRNQNLRDDVNFMTHRFQSLISPNITIIICEIVITNLYFEVKSGQSRSNQNYFSSIPNTGTGPVVDSVSDSNNITLSMSRYISLFWSVCRNFLSKSIRKFCESPALMIHVFFLFFISVSGLKIHHDTGNLSNVPVSAFKYPEIG